MKQLHAGTSARWLLTQSFMDWIKLMRKNVLSHHSKHPSLLKQMTRNTLHIQIQKIRKTSITSWVKATESDRKLISMTNLKRRCREVCPDLNWKVTSITWVLRKECVMTILSEPRWTKSLDWIICRSKIVNTWLIDWRRRLRVWEKQMRVRKVDWLKDNCASNSFRNNLESRMNTRKDRIKFVSKHSLALRNLLQKSTHLISRITLNNKALTKFHKGQVLRNRAYKYTKD